ncbi:uncharacterized protein BDFB_013508 [Asbolus verrucosus]|uniref:Uncharacterized protein n=1 Tax=Asbolus verrucosus TaxID=1661398 RepID=A0A482VVN4_ASBVE|nr:uncharacterized protein BDFB_013508 [Asbolus verrucosus]
MNPDQRFKRPVGTAKSPNTGRTFEASGTSRTQVYLDDETLQRMIESFGPLEYSQETGLKRKSRSPRTEKAVSSPLYLLPQTEVESEESNPSAAEAKRESIIEWFDRSVEKELQKRRSSASPSAGVDPALAPLKAKHALNLSKGTVERISETSASGVEITARLESDFTSELTDAVEKLAKAETMCNYAEALQAAEEAAQNAPPELVEQAAAAEARRIQTEVTRVKETVPGVRPIEVVGYVGITKPYYPKKSI